MSLLMALLGMLGTSLRVTCWISRALFSTCGFAFLLSGLGIVSFKGVGIGFFYLLLAATLSIIMKRLDRLRARASY